MTEFDFAKIRAMVATIRYVKKERLSQPALQVAAKPRARYELGKGKAMDSKLTSVSVAGRQLVKLQEIQSSASRSMISSLNQKEAEVPSIIVSLSAESIRLSKT